LSNMFELLNIEQRQSIIIPVKGELNAL
jgi:hypothetical protein